MRVAPGLEDRMQTLLAHFGSRKRFAEAAGVREGTIRGWLAGSTPHPATIEQIVNRTRCRREWLVDGKGPPWDPGQAPPQPIRKRPVPPYVSLPAENTGLAEMRLREDSATGNGPMEYPLLEVSVPVAEVFCELMDIEQLSMALTQITQTDVLSDRARAAIQGVISRALARKIEVASRPEVVRGTRSPAANPPQTKPQP